MPDKDHVDRAAARAAERELLQGYQSDPLVEYGSALAGELERDPLAMKIADSLFRCNEMRADQCAQYALLAVKLVRRNHHLLNIDGKGMGK